MSSEPANELSQDDVDQHFMRLAIAQAHLCTPTPAAYSVGAILVQPTNQPALLPPTAPPAQRIAEQYRILATGYSRELGDKTHAEEVALLKHSATTSPAASVAPDTPPALCGRRTLYSTMEPCSVRLSGRTACTTLCLEARVECVVAGVEEPSVFVSACQGLRLLREGGVEVRRVRGLEAECLAMNQHLLKEPPR